MASNSGTGLVVGNGKRNQLYRASNAVYQSQKHGVSEIIFEKCSGIISISSSVPLTSTIINQQPAKNSASAMQVRRKFESTTRYVANSRWITQKIRSRRTFSNFRKTMTFDTKYRRK